MPSAMPTYKDYVSDAEGRAQLQTLVSEDRHTDDEQFVPPRVRAAVAGTFLDEVLKPAMKVERLQRAADVARFYVLRSAIPKFLALADRRERELPDYARSIEVLRVTGDLGSADEAKQAAEYYDFLLAHRLFEKAVPQMIECYFHVDPVAEKAIAEPLKRKLQSLNPGGGEPKDPSDEYIDFEQHLNNTLALTTIAKKHKQKVLGERDALKRATLLARAYLGVDDPGGIDWPRWASYALMAELQQSGDVNVVAGLRAALGAIDPNKEQKDYVELARARAARAMAFFGGQLSEDEQGWLGYGKVRRFQLEG